MDFFSAISKTLRQQKSSEIGKRTSFFKLKGFCSVINKRNQCFNNWQKPISEFAKDLMVLLAFVKAEKSKAVILEKTNLVPNTASSLKTNKQQSQRWNQGFRCVKNWNARAGGNSGFARPIDLPLDQWKMTFLCWKVLYKWVPLNWGFMIVKSSRSGKKVRLNIEEKKSINRIPSFFCLRKFGWIEKT